MHVDSKPYSERISLKKATVQVSVIGPPTMVLKKELADRPFKFNTLAQDTENMKLYSRRTLEERRDQKGKMGLLRYWLSLIIAFLAGCSTLQVNLVGPFHGSKLTSF